MKVDDFEFNDTGGGALVELVCPDSYCAKPFIPGGMYMGVALAAVRQHIEKFHSRPGDVDPDDTRYGPYIDE